LEATDWVLDDAVGLYFASHDGHGGSHGGGAGGGSGTAGHSGLPVIPPDQDEVRAPLPTKIERLYGDHFDPRAVLAASAGQFGFKQQREAAPVDVFRDFKAEGEGSGRTPAAGPGPAGLSDLFKPPTDLLFNGDWQMAKMRAGQENKWLLLNVQSNDEFASHRLNRDTWGHDAVRELIQGMFLFYQQNSAVAEGRQLASAYRLSSLPAVLVVDPVTGAKLYERTGFVDPEKLIEELVPFMEHGPNDPGAIQIAQTQSLKRKAPPPAAPPAGAGGAAGGGSRPPMTEDEEMALALAMSMEGAGAGSSGAPAAAGSRPTAAAASDDEVDDLDEEEVWAAIRAQEAEEEARRNRKTPQQVQAEAEARLPPEPAEGAPSSCRVAVRLPDGQRAQRRFNKTDKLQALSDFCLTKLPEAAEGRAFELLPSLPGSTPLTDMEQSLEAAGVANAMLLVKWQA